MFIIFCSVTAQTEKIIPWDFSGAKKRSYLVKNNLFENKSNHSWCKCQTTKRLQNKQHATLCQNGWSSAFYCHPHSLTLTFPWHCDVASKRTKQLYNKGKISAQPHTIVKQSNKPNLLLSSLFPLAKNCMYDKIWGCCVLKSCRYLT